VGRGNFGRQAASKEITARPGNECVLTCGHRIVHTHPCRADRHYCWVCYRSDIETRRVAREEEEVTA